jgi:hypothetical protein
MAENVSDIVELKSGIAFLHEQVRNSESLNSFNRNISSVKADFQSSHEAPRSPLRVMHEHFHPITMLNR